MNVSWRVSLCPSGTGLGNVHFWKCIFVLDICCQQLRVVRKTWTSEDLEVRKACLSGDLDVQGPGCPKDLEVLKAWTSGDLDVQGPECPKDLDVLGPGCPGPECPGPVCPGPGCPPVSVLWWSFSNFQSIFFNNKNQHWMVDSKNFHLSLQLVSNTSWTFRVCVWSTVMCTALIWLFFLSLL